MLYLNFLSGIFWAYISISKVSYAILPALPNSIRIDSEVTLYTPSSVEVYVVEEYVDSFDGSIRVTVQDITDDLGETDLNSYYRIKEYFNDQTTIPGFNDYLLVVDHKDSLCLQTTTDTWQLKGLTRVLDVLYKSNEFTTLEVEDDRTSLATLALLKIVYANAKLFLLEKEDYLTSQLTSSYFFQTKIELDEDDRIAKIICAMPVANVMNKGRLEVGKSLLSEVDSATHPILVAMIEYHKDDDETNKLNPLELINLDNKDLLTVSYHLVHERSTSSQQGMKLGNHNEQNPFSLPSGAGCYSSSLESLLYISAKQFSGVYESLDYPNKRYIAYDSVTSHLRFDTLDESKIIYNFRQRKLTYIMDTTHEKQQMIGSGENETQKARCTQTSLNNDDEDDILQKVRSMEHVIGFDQSLSLVYLGTIQLEDGTHCLVYEREIGPSQIPFIIQLNLRLKILKNSRLFLVYYFVNEFSVQNPKDYRSVWLKRMELTSLNSFSKYKLLNSRITFSQFAWDLESLVDDSSLSDAELLHPVRTFDIIECQSTRAYSNLEILLKQDITESLNDNNNRTISSGSAVGQQFDSLEEALMVCISKLIDFSRSELNEFELIRMSSEIINQLQYVLVKAKLMNPLDVTISSKLVGWCKNIDDMPFNRYGSFVDTDGPIIRQECMLKMATEQQKKVVTMVFCPTHGWCAQLDDVKSFDYIKKKTEGEEPDPNIYVCQVYTISKELESFQLVSDRLRKNSLAKTLHGKEIAANIAAEMGQINQTGMLSLFKANVVKVSVTNVNEVETMGSLLRENQCYTTMTKVNAPDADFKLEIKEIVLDRHHSLFFCHKACQIYPNCLTYSYATSSRTCTLTNVPDNYVERNNQSRLVDEDILSELKEDTDCSLYSLNAMYLFRNKWMILITRPSVLEADKRTDYYITFRNLEYCAKLCNLNSLNCQTFLHNPLNGICAIEDKDFQVYKRKTLVKGEVYNKEVKRDNYIQLLGAENWSTAHSFHQYTRDYDQYYVIEHTQKIDLTESSYTVGEGDKQARITRSASDSLEEIATLYDLDSKSCLRECTSIRPDCVMADYCFHPIKGTPTRYCTLYRISAKSAADNSSNLMDLGKSSLVSASGCTHYQLNEDFLLLKQILAGHWSKIGQEIAKEDSERSKQYLNSTSNINSSKWKLSTYSIVGHLSLLTIGLYVGMLLSYQSSKLQTSDIGSKLLSKCISAYHWLRLRGQLGRTQSREELNEMEDF